MNIFDLAKEIRENEIRILKARQSCLDLDIELLAYIETERRANGGNPTIMSGVYEGIRKNNRETLDYLLEIVTSNIYKGK